MEDAEEQGQAATTAASAGKVNATPTATATANGSEGGGGWQVACSHTRRSVGAVLRRASAAAYSTVDTNDDAEDDEGGQDHPSRLAGSRMHRRPSSSPSRRARAREPSFDEVFFIDDL